MALAWKAVMYQLTWCGVCALSETGISYQSLDIHNHSLPLTIIFDGQDLCGATALAAAIAEHGAPEQPAQALDSPAGGLTMPSLGPVRRNTKEHHLPP